MSAESDLRYYTNILYEKIDENITSLESLIQHLNGDEYQDICDELIHLKKKLYDLINFKIQSLAHELDDNPIQFTVERTDTDLLEKIYLKLGAVDI